MLWVMIKFEGIFQGVNVRIIEFETGFSNTPSCDHFRRHGD